MSKAVVAIVDDLYEDLELWYPLLRMEEEGWKVTIAGPEEGKLYHGKYGYPCTGDGAIEDINSNAYDVLLLPGGLAPDKLRRDPDVLRLTKEFNTQGKVIAFICHAGWIPVSAKIVEGKKVTSTIGIKDDMENAGAIWVDEPTVIDGNLVSSRGPKDLPLFTKAIIDTCKKK